MTYFGDSAVAELLSGMSDVLGRPFPGSPPPVPAPPDPTPRGGKFGSVSQPAPPLSPPPAPLPGTTPQSPPYAGMPWPPRLASQPPAGADPRDSLTPDERAALTYQGIDPATAPLSEINRVLTGLGKPARGPTPPPGQPPAPGQPTSPGQPPPTTPPAADGLDGAMADAAKRVDDALQKNHSVLNEADAQLADAILRAGASDQQGKIRLQDLQQSIVDEVKKLGPTLDTPAGQQQLADFLQGKTAQILDVLKTARLDASSHGAVLDALAARYQAVGDQHTGDRGGDAAAGSSAPASTAASALAPAAASSDAASPAQPPRTDPLLGGLASDPLMAGLGPPAPALGALGGLPAMMGSMSPFGAGMGGGGVPLGDIGSGIGSAIRDAVHGRDGSPSADKPDDLEDRRLTSNDVSPSHDPGKPGPLKDQPDRGATKPPAGPGGTQPAAADAAPAPAPPTPAGPSPADTSVKLPDGTTVAAASAALARAGRSVLAGANINDAYQQAGISLSAPGTPVSSPVSPSQLVFGDVGQFTDHRVLALGGGKVWVNGQVSPLDQLDTGPNFLGWEHPAALSTAAEVTAGSSPSREVR